MATKEMMKRVHANRDLLECLQALAFDCGIDWEDIPDAKIKGWAEFNLEHFYNESPQVSRMKKLIRDWEPNAPPLP